MPTGLIEMIMKQPFLGEEKHDKLWPSFFQVKGNP
jgi:hypothetical protein